MLTIPSQSRGTGGPSATLAAVRGESAARRAGPDSGAQVPHRVLVVEDDDDLRDVLVSSLAVAGLRAVPAATAAEALATVRDEPVDLVLLDVGLPDRSGFDVGADLRRLDLPVIFLTARDELRDKLAAFEAGADDYITKPFSLAELVARIRAVAARSAGPQSEVARYADVEVDVRRHQARRGARELDLTATEFRLLHYLVVNAEHVVSRQQILNQVWRYDFEGNTSVVENYVSFLRRKLDDRDGQLLRTIRGVGYTLRAEV